jgi:hypothetical protein
VLVAKCWLPSAGVGLRNADQTRALNFKAANVPAGIHDVAAAVALMPVVIITVVPAAVAMRPVYCPVSRWKRTSARTR